MALWYVDNAASGANDGTSWTDAWESLAEIGWGSISAGDTIYLSGGSTTKRYAEPLVPGASGSSGSPIVITRGVDSGHDGEPIIDRENGAAAWYGVDNGWSSTARNYITVKNIAAENAASAGIHSRNSAGFRVENCRVLCGSVTTDQPRGIDLRSTTDAVVTGCTIRTPSSTTGQTDGIYSQGSDNLTIVDNDVQVDNTDDTGHSDAWQSVSDGDVLVERNRFVSPTSGGNNHVVIISDILDAATITFRNNICWSRGGQYNVTYFRAGSGSTNGTLLVYNNTIYGGDRAVNLERTSAVELKNNVIWPDAAGTGVYVNLTDLTAGNVLNNLVYAPSATIARTVADGNRTWAQWTATDGYNSGGVNDDPDFTAAGSGDFTLLGTSPAIDAGVTLASVTVDKGGNARPQGDGYDIGAYEVLDVSIVTMLGTSIIASSNMQDSAETSPPALLTDIDEDPTSLDGLAWTLVDPDSAGWVRIGFDTPAQALLGTQAFQVALFSDPDRGADATIALYEDGALVRTLVDAQPVSSSGTLFEPTWAASEITAAADVEIRIDLTPEAL